MESFLILPAKGTPIERRHDSYIKLCVNWFKRRKLFDFAEVVITHASDEEMERFAVKIGNDTDPIRRWKYKEMICTVSPQNVLPENSMRILQKTFGKVEISL